MLRQLKLCLVLAGLLPLLLLAAEEEKAENPKKQKKDFKVLWIASPEALYHQLPEKLAALLKQGANLNMTSEKVLCPGLPINHLFKAKAEDLKKITGLKEGETIQQKITAGKYDYVVLHINPERLDLLNEQVEMKKSLGEIYDFVKQTGAEPIFYPTSFIKGKVSEQSAKIRIRHEAAKVLGSVVAKEKKAKMATCALAWEWVREQYPKMALLNNMPGAADDSPGPYGIMLNMFIFYTTITEKNAAGLEMKEFERCLPAQLQKKKGQPTESLKLDQSIVLYLQEMGWLMYRKHSVPNLIIAPPIAVPEIDPETGKKIE